LCCTVCEPINDDDDDDDIEVGSSMRFATYCIETSDSSIIIRRLLMPYWFVPKNKDWYSADKYCRSKSRRLVIIANKDDQKRLSKFLQGPWGQFYSCVSNRVVQKAVSVLNFVITSVNVGYTDFNHF